MSKAEQPSDLFDDKCKILFNYLPMPSYAWQRVHEDFILINYNHAAHEITGGAIEEFLGIKASELYKDRPEIIGHLELCAKEKSNFIKEMKYEFISTGIERFFSATYGFIPPDIVVVHTTDITEKRKAEIKSKEMEFRFKQTEKELKKLNNELEQKIEEKTEELKKSEQQYRLIAENVNDMIAILNEDQIYEYINEGIHNQQRGTSNELLIGTSPLDIVHPDEVEMNRKSFRKTLKEGEGVLETRIRNLWGGYNWFEVKGKTFIDVDGKKKVLLIARDITERKQNLLRLKQSERKYRHLFEKSPYRIVLINTDGKIIDYKSATSNEGLNKRVDVIGGDFRELKFITPANLQILKKMFTDLLIKGFTNPVEVDFGKESNLGWTNLHASIVQIDNQKIIQVLVEDINERKNAEISLKESEENYRLISENANDAIVIVGKNAKIKYINKKPFKKNFGYNPDDIIGRTPNEFIHPDELENSLFPIEKLIKRSKGLIETRIRHKKGHYIDVELSVSVFLDKDGELNQLIFLRNITKRKHAEVKLNESEQRHRLITENINDLIGIINAQFKFEYFNEKILRELSGYSKRERIGKSPLELIHPDDGEKVKNILTRAFKTGEGIVALRFRNKTLNYIWLEVKGKTFIDIDGKKKLLVISRDITERKRAEENLKASEEKYRLISENANDLVRVIDSKFKTTYINEQTHLKLLGYTKDDLLGKSVRHIVHPDEAKDLDKLVRELAKTGEGKREGRIQHKNGHWLWFDMVTKLYKESNGKLKGLSISRDITEKKLAEQRLKESEQKFRTIAEQWLMGICIIQDNRVKFLNQQLANLLGYTTEEFLSWQPGEFFKTIHPDDRPMVLEQAQKRGNDLNSGIRNYLARGIHKSGRVIWLEVWFKNIEYEGKPAFLNTFIDITDKKTAEEKLKDSEEKYRNMINNLDVGIFKTDINGILLAHNPTFNKVFGFDPSKNLIGTSAQDLWENREDIQNYFKNLIKKGVSRNFIHKGKKVNGEIIFLQADSHLIRDKDNKILEIEGTISDITENHILEQKLKESEEIFRSITEQSLLGIAIMQGSRIKYVNNQLAEVFGQPVDDALNWQPNEFLKLIHPDDRLFVAEQAMKKQSGEQDAINRYQFRGLKAGGDIIWCEVFSKTIIFQGKPANLVTIVDITEKKKSELKLIESEEKYRNLVENIPQRIFLKDKNSVYISCNKNYATDLKIKADEINGKTDYDFYPKELAEKYRADDKRIISSGEAEEIDEFDILYGNERYVRTIKTPIRDNSGNITGLIGIFWDITERKEAEEKISNLAKFPAENPNPVLRVDKEKIIYINQTGQMFFNLNVGAKIPVELYDIIQTAFKESITKTSEIERANKICSFDIAPIQDSGYANIYGNDITERKEGEQKVKRSEEKYRDAFNRANFYKDLFVHDINNIMQVINSSAELISYQSDQVEQTIDIDMITNMIKKQVMRAKKLVQSVNTLSELENNEKPIQPTEVCGLMKKTFNYISTAYQERNVTINFEYFSKRIYAMANDVLQDVFDNIIINSVKYTIESSPEIFVKISKEKRDKIKYIKFEFIDNGIGIADDRKEIIFKRGHREFKGQKGMGLGLSLVKKIVKNYNGKIWVEDRVKDDHTQGSNFILLIPQST